MLQKHTTSYFNGLSAKTSLSPFPSLNACRGALLIMLPKIELVHRTFYYTVMMSTGSCMNGTK